MFSKEDVANWKQNPVTKKLVEDCTRAIEEAKDQLSESAGLYSISDRELVGIIKGLREILDWTPAVDGEQDA